jgi:DNA-binding Lrp family transcriptional regulator
MLDLDQIDLKLLELLQQSAKLTTKKLHSRLIYQPRV